MEVRASERDLSERSRPLFPPGWREVGRGRVEHSYSLVASTPPSGGRERHFELYADDLLLFGAADRDAILDRFEAELHRHVAEMSPNRVFVHAGVVGWRGRAIVVAGRSFAGKTTLVRELVERGATYYSDEFAVLDARGRVHPFARPLAVRDAGGRQARVPVESIGGRAGRAPLPVGLVVAAPYRPGARWRPRRLSAGKGVLELLGNTVSARRQPERALEVLSAVVGQAPVLTGVRGEARASAAAILALCDRGRRVLPSFHSRPKRTREESR